MNREQTLDHLNRVQSSIARGYAIGPTTRRPDYAAISGDDLPEEWASLRRRKLVSTTKVSGGWAIKLTDDGRRYLNKFNGWRPM